MKLVAQRVKEAKVTVDGETMGTIGPGILVLLGVHKEDTPDKTAWFVNKLLNLRIFEDENGKMNRNRAFNAVPIFQGKMGTALSECFCKALLMKFLRLGCI